MLSPAILASIQNDATGAGSGSAGSTGISWLGGWSGDVPPTWVAVGIGANLVVALWLVFTLVAIRRGSRAGPTPALTLLAAAASAGLLGYAALRHDFVIAAGQLAYTLLFILLAYATRRQQHGRAEPEPVRPIVSPHSVHLRAGRSAAPERPA